MRAVFAVGIVTAAVDRAKTNQAQTLGTKRQIWCNKPPGCVVSTREDDSSN
jgi:hypothetical protein